MNIGIRISPRLASSVRCAFVLTAIACTATAVSAQDDMLLVPRAHAVYDSALTGRKIDRRVTSWYNGWTSRPKSMTAAEWADERGHILEESRVAGIDGPFAPGVVSALGEKELDTLTSEFGMKFPFQAHSSTYARDAKNAGAKFIFGMGYVSGELGKPAPWDPAYREVSARGIEKWLMGNGKKPWLSCVLGFDEPFNYAGTVRTPGAVDIVNRDLRGKYGVTIALTALDTTKAYYEWPTEPAILNKPSHDVELLRVAVWRWLNEQLRISAKQEFDLVRKYAPGVNYIAYNRNAINIYDFIDTDVRNSLDRIDQAAYYDFTDCFSADPYPTQNLSRDGRDRALYHVGFISKLITDLAGGKPSTIIMQGFKFVGRFPTTENLREWTSQAAKSGVTNLEWFGWPRTLDPELYREMLRLSRLWKGLPALDIPSRAEIAVLFSDDSRNAVNDAMMNAHYTLHILLGEQLGAWFAFTGENQVRKGIQNLDSAKLIIAPQLSWVSREFARTLDAKVRAGAALFVLDPDAFDWDIETGSLSRERMNLLGAPLGKPWEASELVPTAEGSKRFPGVGRLLLLPGASGVTARKLAVPRDAAVLFTYADGVPAVYSRPLGKGEVVVFGAQPFGGVPLGLRPMGWDVFFASAIDRLSIARNLPVWRFLLPATGGETALYRPATGQ
jgi:hypothetical protein